MPHIFTDWQEEYAARGLPTFPVNPIAPDGRKLPGTRGYGKVGFRGSRQIALKFSDKDTNGLGCMAGVRRGPSHLVLALIDIDARGAEADRLVADVQLLYGPSRFIVRTGNDGRHLYYRWSGEGRKIRPDPSIPIDILGGGVVVLPPSLGAKQPYEIIHGHLDDLTALTKIARTPEPPAEVTRQVHDQGGTAPTAARNDLAGMREGDGRNRTLFEIMCSVGHDLPLRLDAFIARAREENMTCAQRMPDDEVIRIATNVFEYREDGELRTGQHGGLWLPPSAKIKQLIASNTDLFVLIAWLRPDNGPRSTILVADGMAVQMGWPPARLRLARRAALNAGWIVQVAKPSPGYAALYRWGPMAEEALWS